MQFIVELIKVVLILDVAAFILVIMRKIRIVQDLTSIIKISTVENSKTMSNLFLTLLGPKIYMIISGLNNGKSSKSIFINDSLLFIS